MAGLPPMDVVPKLRWSLRRARSSVASWAQSAALERALDHEHQLLESEAASLRYCSAPSFIARTAVATSAKA